MHGQKISTVYICHYSELKERNFFLLEQFKSWGSSIRWVTEINFNDYKTYSFPTDKKSKIRNSLLSMDLWINFKTFSWSRRKSKLLAYAYYSISFLQPSLMNSKFGKINEEAMKTPIIEVTKMHLTCLEQGISEGSDWIFVVEDDAIAAVGAMSRVARIARTQKPINSWVNLNSGAELRATASDKIGDSGLFRVKPASTRCAAAYLISADLAQKIIMEASSHGIPDYLPIDFYYQLLLRKFRAKTYWTEPPVFDQGSESGEFLSGLSRFRFIVE